MRAARHSDIDYFVETGRAFCQHTPFAFDKDSYSAVIHELVDDPDVISVVDGDPPQCHSVAILTPNFYNADEIIARVFTTWGTGGLKCFAELERQAKERGAKFIMADSMIAPRIIRFYKRRGMKRADAVFIKEL